MTPEEFKARAQELYDRNKGYGHYGVEALMKECLDSLGYEEGTNILLSMDNIWYS